MKTEVLNTYPEAVIDLKTIDGMNKIQDKDGFLQMGAMTRLADIAGSEALGKTYPVLTEAAGSVGSPELRNMATLGGNLCQDTRCWYYRYPDSMGGSMPCYRKGKGPCHAVSGDNRYHAILGGKKCYAVCPSDMAVALTALDAKILIAHPQGSRTVSISDFYDIFGAKISTGEVVTQIHIPSLGADNRQRFLKFRLRESIDFAVVSVAVSMTMESGICRKARIVIGGVAPIPYIAEAAQEVLNGRPLDEKVAKKAAAAAVADAKPLTRNAYKVDLTVALVQRALMAWKGEEQDGTTAGRL